MNHINRPAGQSPRNSCAGIRLRLRVAYFFLCSIMQNRRLSLPNPDARCAPYRAMAEFTFSRCLGLCGLVAFSFGAMAQEPPPEDSESKWGAHIDFEAKPGSKRTLGEADLFVPLVQDERTLVFGNLRGRMDDNSSHEGNLGLGVRRMLPKGWNLGTYGYFDRRRTDEGNYFNQATVGAEALGSDWDFRANGYIPLGDRIRDLGTTGGGPSTAALSGTVVQITTPGSITREERAFGGFDAEVGWRLPVFDAEAPNQLRVYAGGYRFGDSVVKVAGPRFRVELAMAQVPGLWEGSQLFVGAETQDDSERGSQTFASIRIRIPLGGNPERARQFTLQERRMTAPVMRDVDIVTQARVAATTPELVETATETADGKTFTVLSSGTTTGAALNGALATAGVNSKVILSGTFNTTAATTLQSGQTVMGVGTHVVRSPSGHTATLTTQAATISATTSGASGAAVSMANNSTLAGMNINQAYGGGVISLLGVNADGVNGATIANNTISVNSSSSNAFGVRVISNASNNTISGNTITVTNTNGNAIALQMASGGTATVTGNTFYANGTTADYAISRSSSTALSGSTGNVVTAGTCQNSGGNTGSVSYTSGGVSATCP
ncbi:MAG: inverse autotransporter beta domain-containing protein [Methylobacter sp.]|nr:inverse autotransporter beta domain-containing protein [Methylobacter sp.]